MGAHTFIALIEMPTCHGNSEFVWGSVSRDCPAWGKAIRSPGGGVVPVVRAVTGERDHTGGGGENSSRLRITFRPSERRGLMTDNPARLLGEGRCAADVCAGEKQLNTA